MAYKNWLDVVKEYLDDFSLDRAKVAYNKGLSPLEFVLQEELYD